MEPMRSANCSPPRTRPGRKLQASWPRQESAWTSLLERLVVPTRMWRQLVYFLDLGDSRDFRTNQPLQGISRVSREARPSSTPISMRHAICSRCGGKWPTLSPGIRVTSA